jgi:hypothetical protein
LGGKNPCIGIFFIREKQFCWAGGIIFPFWIIECAMLHRNFVYSEFLFESIYGVSVFFCGDTGRS